MFIIIVLSIIHFDPPNSNEILLCFSRKYNYKLYTFFLYEYKSV